MHAPEDQVKCGLLLNVIITQCSSILELLASKNKSLLIGGDTIARREAISSRCSTLSTHINTPFLVLDFGLDIVDGVGGFDLEGDRLPREGLDEDLHL
jgi:hypothetical protein